MRFQFEGKSAVIMVALECADLKMGVEVSFKVRYLIEGLPTFVIRAESPPFYRFLYYKLMILLFNAYVIHTEIL